MIVVSGGSWDFCNCMFCTECGCKSSGCLDWGHWSVENRWVKGKGNPALLFHVPFASSQLRPCPQEQLRKTWKNLTRLPCIDRADTHGVWILASQSLSLRLGPLPILAKPWAWSWAPQNSRGDLQGRGQPSCKNSIILLVLRGWSYADIPFQCHQLY